MQITPMGVLVWAHGLVLILMPAIVAMFFIPPVHKQGAEEHEIPTHHKEAA